MNTAEIMNEPVRQPRPRRWLWLVMALLLVVAEGVFAQAAGGTTNAPANGFNLNIGMNMPDDPKKVNVAIRIVFLITLLTVAPSLVMLMTSFTRIIIVFSFLRNALSLQGVPANQIMVGFALFMTFFIMQPVYQRVDTDAIQPYSNGAISGTQALDNAKGHIKDFMLRQARPKDVEFFVGLAKMGPTKVEDLPMSVVIPGFILSELRTGFQMGFLLFIPFILIDFVVAIVLMSPNADIVVWGTSASLVCAA